MTELSAKAGDRNASLKQSIGDLKANAARERSYFEDAKNLEKFTASRKQNEMDAKFCWK